MTRAATPELDTVTTQADALRLIDGGANWHTSIGRRVYLQPLADESPPDHIALADVSVEHDGRLAGLVSATWRAVVPIDRPDALDPLLVLADMRKALTCVDDRGRTAVNGCEITLRASGSNYAVVTVTASEYVSIA